LLEDGLGDTIRVSLTEDPEFEAPVAISLVNRYKKRSGHKEIKPVSIIPKDPFNYEKKNSFELSGIGGSNFPRVVADFSHREIGKQNDLNDIGYFYDSATDKWNMNDLAADIISLGESELPFDIPNGLKAIINFSTWKNIANKKQSYPLMTVSDYFSSVPKAQQLNFVRGSISNFSIEALEKIKHDRTVVLVIETDNDHGVAEQRRFFFDLLEHGLENPVIIKRDYKNLNLDELRLYTSTDFGSLLIDGFGDGVWASIGEITEKGKFGSENAKKEYVRTFVNKHEAKENVVNRILFGILQAARVRISKTEYIACPSCGRTLFDLQDTTEMIRKRTEHLKGVKIAIMGCIVNGPGEMADADYGYVGSGVGKITLYKGKDIVIRNIPMGNAVNSLIEIIKEDGNWLEPN
jgi:(E)-4-hydroxy-3-methylbut-2-enyl-diphosphate synthase